MSVVSARQIPSLRRSAAKPITREHQVSWWVAAVLLGIVTVLFFVSAYFGIRFLNRPFLGMALMPTQVVTGGQPTGSERWNALEAGVASRDRLVALDGVPLSTDPFDYATARASIEAFLSRARVGQVVEATFVRPDGERFSVSYPLTAFPAGDSVIYFLIPALSGAVALVAGILILLYSGYNRTAITGAVICALTGFMLFGLFDAPSGYLLTPLWMLGTCGLGGFLVRFGLTFPSTLTVGYRLPAVTWLPVVGGVLLGFWALSYAFAPPTPNDFSQGQLITIGTALIGAVALAVLLINQRQRVTTRVARDQAGVLLMGLLLSTTPGLIWFSQSIIRNFIPTFELPLTIESSVPFLLTIVLSMTFVLVQQRTPDADRMLSQSVAYSVLMIGLITGYFLLTLGAGLIVRNMAPDNTLVIAILMFLVAVFFLPVRNRLQDRIDRIYFRQQRELSEIVEDFGQSLEDLGNAADTLDGFQKAVRQGVSPKHILIFLQRMRGADYVAEATDLRFAAEGATAVALKALSAPLVFERYAPFPTGLMADRARIESLQPSLITTMNSSEDLIGFVVFGAPQGRGGYAYEEVRFLNALTSQLSVVLERALVVESLEQRVRELNVLSQVGQAANYTNTLDDLLELVTAQTARLLDAEYQYIVFFDAERSQLYYAFFLEEDERDGSRERLRWPLSNDLYSQIIRSGQPRIMDDYARFKQGEGVQFLSDSNRTRAFMAVPLTAQTHRLGVFAVGKRSPQPYTAEEISTFTNLAALAATALEKAQLFDEVNRRARQLGALNEISQQLVAAETDDVNALLELITTSAVGILDSEAGSLLLADENDEAANQMVFRAVIGGASQELLGQRVPSNRGLIGEVVRTGRPPDQQSGAER